MTEILSYGGGTQTVAMCVLVAQGKLPKPDYVIAADTGREMPTTWEYADKYMRPLLASVGMDLHVAPHTLATVDLYSGNGDLLLPVFTETGKLKTYCSVEWKQRVVHRYARKVLGTGTDLVNWIGFSLDEISRVNSEAGRRCVCNSEIEHEHCICSDTACACHAPDAYHMELVHDGAGREYYVPTGARLVRKVREAAAWRDADGTALDDVLCWRVVR